MEKINYEEKIQEKIIEIITYDLTMDRIDNLSMPLEQRQIDKYIKCIQHVSNDIINKMIVNYATKGCLHLLENPDINEVEKRLKHYLPKEYNLKDPSLYF